MDNNLMRPTLKDVAKLSQKSLTTVSMVLSDDEGAKRISEETKQRIHEAAKKLGYRPHFFGKALRSQQTKQIGLVIPNLFHPYMQMLIKGCGDVAKQWGYNLILMNMTDLTGDEVRSTISSYIHSNMVDGLVVHSMGKTLRNTVEHMHVAYVEETEYLPSVTFDGNLAAYQITKLLLDEGIDDLVFINGNIPVQTFDVRTQGFIKACEERGITIDPSNMLFVDSSLQGGLDAFETLKVRSCFPKGIVVATDVIAHPILMQLVAGGVRVPEDVRIASIDDIEFSSIITPSLTSVHVDAERIGREATDILLDLIQGKLVEKVCKTIPIELVIRQSSGK